MSAAGRAADGPLTPSGKRVWTMGAGTRSRRAAAAGRRASLAERVQALEDALADTTARLSAAADVATAARNDMDLAQQRLRRAEARSATLEKRLDAESDLDWASPRIRHERAAEGYAKAAEQRNAKAQYGLGYCYQNGEGVAKDLERWKDLERAGEWFTKAAEQNHAGAQAERGDCYATGEGVAKSEERAVEWWRKAAKQGNKNSQNSLHKRGLAFVVRGPPK